VLDPLLPDAPQNRRAAPCRRRVHRERESTVSSILAHRESDVCGRKSRSRIARGECLRLAHLDEDTHRTCLAKISRDWNSSNATSQRTGQQMRNGRLTAHPHLHGDVILARKDTPASYHLCVVHDDAQQQVSHVIRGEDLRSATHVHVLLQKLLGFPTPICSHHALLTGPDGKRYAKRDKSLTLAALREAGVSPAGIRTASDCPLRPRRPPSSGPPRPGRVPSC